MSITKEFGGEKYAIREAHLIRCIHASAFDMGLLLSHGRLKSKSHLRVLLEREDCLHFKEYADRWFERRKLTNHSDAVHDVSGKTGNRLGDNQIDASGIAIGNHLIESGAVRDRRTADAFICVYLYKSPVRMTHNEFLVVFLLQLIRRCLIRIAGRYADVHGHTLMCVIIIKIDLRLSGDTFNQAGINALITSSDLRLLLLFRSMLFCDLHVFFLLFCKTKLLSNSTESCARNRLSGAREKRFCSSKKTPTGG